MKRSARGREKPRPLPAGVAGGGADDREALAAPNRTWSISLASNCMAMSLKASVGP